MNVEKSEIEITGDYAVSVLRKYQNDCLKKVIEEFPYIKTVLNIGARQNDPDKEGGVYRDYFIGKEYYTLDKNKISNEKNHYNIDLHKVSSIRQKFDLILNMNTLEHVENPVIVIKNLQKLLNKTGLMYVCTPFFYPIHKDKQDRYSDYWRFTDDGLRILFKDMREIFMIESPSVIMKVADRPIYYDDPKATVSGYCALFQKIK